MELTEFGMLIEVILLHRLKASSSMVVTGSPSMVPGMTKAPEAEVAQVLIVILPFVV